MDHSFDAVVIGAKIKCLGASPIGAKLLAHVGVDAELVVTWQPAQRQLYWRRRALIFTMRWTCWNLLSLKFYHNIDKFEVIMRPNPNI
jgi:hypothetical protein